MRFRQRISPSPLSSPDADADVGHCPVDFFSELIRLIAIAPEEGKVLMMKYEDDSWDFPYFYFPHIDAKNIGTCLSGLQERLGLDASVANFAVIAELLGSFYAKYPKVCGIQNQTGLSKMLLLDSQQDLELKLPNNMAWKDSSFIQAINLKGADQGGFHAITARVLKFLQEEIVDLNNIWQPGHQLGWYKKACMWFQHVVQDESACVIGPIVQCRMNCVSTILKVNSDRGAYFLKSPTFGTNEIHVTLLISRVLSTWTLTVLGISEELACFVSREFIPFEQGDDEQKLRSLSIRSLGSLHRASMEVKRDLIEGGCAVVDSSALLAELWKWKEDLHSNLSALMPDFETCVTLVEARFRGLNKYKIPLTLTHGYMSFSNVGLAKDTETGRVIFYDWQFAAISHPFFDFHLIHEEISDVEREQYLRTWCDYEPMDRLREAFKIAHPLGWLLKLRGIALSKRHRMPELNSELDTFFSTAWGILNKQLVLTPTGSSTPKTKGSTAA